MYSSLLSPLQNRTIEALITCPSKSKACELVGIARTTLWNWLRAPEFVWAFEMAAKDAQTEIVSHSKLLAAQALDVLGEEMAEPSEASRERVSAADKILKHWRGAVEMDVVQEAKALMEELRHGRSPTSPGATPQDRPSDEPEPPADDTVSP